MAIAILFLFMYQAFILENTKMIDGMNDRFGSVILPVISISFYAFIFVVTLVSFPAFWFKSLMWFPKLTQLILGSKTVNLSENKNDIYGLLVSSMFIIFLVLMSFYVQNKFI